MVFFFFPLFFFFFFFPPDISHQILIMEMFLITLISRVVYRRRYDELDPPECITEEAGVKKQTPILNVAVREDGL